MSPHINYEKNLFAQKWTMQFNHILTYRYRFMEKTGFKNSHATYSQSAKTDLCQNVPSVKTGLTSLTLKT